MDGVRTLSSRYRVEPDLRIGWTSANWDRFARENGAPELAGGAVVGCLLWDFMEGTRTRELYRAVLTRVRDTGVEVTIPFRCDSPDARRFMKLRMIRPSDARVELVAELLREEPRPRVDLLDTQRSRTGDPVRICSFCKRIESQTGAWIEVEEAAPVADGPLPPLDHCVCPGCEEMVDTAASA